MYPQTQAFELSQRNNGKATDRPGVLWLQGEDSCGLAVIAVTLEHVLARQGYNVTLLDHDQINSGLCRDLSNSNEHRQEYARRVAETAKLFDESGTLAIVIVDSLNHSEHANVRDILRESIYSCVYLEFPEFGSKTTEKLDDISAIKCVADQAVRTFVKPNAPNLHLNTSTLRNEDSINTLLEHLDQRGSLRQGYSPLATVHKRAKNNDVVDTPISIGAG